MKINENCVEEEPQVLCGIEDVSWEDVRSECGALDLKIETC